MAYTLLGGVRVLEVALLAPDLLGMHLADLGAEVVKIEQPPGGDYLREIGGRRRAGLNLMHLRWNRGKKSVTLDLRRREGQRLLHRLAARADVFIDGLRPGAAARCAADYATLAAVNPRLVYCTLCGAGTWGPYAALPTHGVAYDAFAGLAPPATHPWRWKPSHLAYLTGKTAASKTTPGPHTTSKFTSTHTPTTSP